MEEMAEASGEFEIEQLQPFLERIAALVPFGFGDAEIAAVVALAQGMAVEDEETLDFSIRYAGADAALRITVFMDDLDSPGVYFFAPPPLAEQITEEIVTLATEQEGL